MLEVIEIGEKIYCDLCNKDFSESDRSGGLLYGSKAVCPDCQGRMEEGAKKYNEESYIKARCPENMSFRDFVLKIRNGDNTIKIWS